MCPYPYYAVMREITAPRHLRLRMVLYDKSRGIKPAAKGLARHSTITLTMDHYTHTPIDDERAALDRPSTNTHTESRQQSPVTTGATEARSAFTAHAAPKSPILSTTGHDTALDNTGAERAELLENTGTCQQSPTLGNKTGPLAQRLEQGTHNRLQTLKNKRRKTPLRRNLRIDPSELAQKLAKLSPNVLQRLLSAAENVGRKE